MTQMFDLLAHLKKKTKKKKNRSFLTVDGQACSIKNIWYYCALQQSREEFWTNYQVKEKMTNPDCSKYYRRHDS